MALVLPPLSDAPSVTSSHADHVEHFRSQGYSEELSEALYMAMRLQDKGQSQQAAMYYTAILRMEPECTVAKVNLDMLVGLSRPEVQHILHRALEAEQAARRAAEEEEARRVAAEAAAEEERRRQEEAARAEEARRQAVARAREEQRQAAEVAAQAEQRRQALRQAEKQRRVQESLAFVLSKAQEKQARRQATFDQLRKQFPGLNLGSICIDDVRPGNGGLICRSTYGTNGIGNGWQGDFYTSASSGRVYNSRNQAPEPCFNCGEYHFRRFCPWGRR